MFILVPRSPLHACLQILLCALLFRARPDLLPSWQHVPVAAVLAAALVLSARLQLYTRCATHKLAAILSHVQVELIRTSALLTTCKSCGLIARLQSCTQRAAKLLRGTREALLFCVAGVVHLLVRRGPALAAWFVGAARRGAAAWGRRCAAAVRDAAAWLWPLSRQAACAAWARTAPCLYQLYEEAKYASHTLQSSSRPCRRGVVDVRRALESCAAMCAAAVRSSSRQLVWTCLFIGHFLAFTLGLTIVFPWLCMYGLVVSFLHFLLSQGTTTLASDVVSLLGL